MADIKITDLTISEPVTGDLWVTNDTGHSLYFNGTNWEEQQEETETRMSRLEKMVEKIADRLAVLDEPDPEKLEQFKTLKDAYTKYKFIEGLCGEKEQNG